MRRLFAFLFSAAPFVAGVIAAVSARHDLRILWMAAAVTLAGRVVLALVPATRGAALGVAAALAAATAAASGVALLLGAHAAFAIGAVAFVLAAFAVTGAAVGRRPHTPV